MDPRPARVARRRWRALLSITLLAPTLWGCNDEPECHLGATLGGYFEGPVDWSPTGRESCGFADTTVLAPGTSAFAFITEGEQRESVYVVLEQPTIEMGTHLGRMLFTYAGDVWASAPGSCTVDLTEFVREEWTQTDFMRFQGTVSCPDPLIPVDPELAELTMSEIDFDGHAHAEVLTYTFP